MEEDGISAQLEDLKVEDAGLQLRDSLLQQCRVLLNELEEFQQYLVKQKKDNGVELRHFKSSVRTEVNFLEKVCIPVIFATVIKRCQSSLSRICFNTFPVEGIV